MRDPVRPPGVGRAENVDLEGGDFHWTGPTRWESYLHLSCLSFRLSPDGDIRSLRRVLRTNFGRFGLVNRSPTQFVKVQFAPCSAAASSARRNPRVPGSGVSSDSPS